MAKVYKVIIRETDIREHGIQPTQQPLVAQVRKQLQEGSVPLAAQMQHDNISVWYLCPHDYADLSWYTFTVVGTGMLNDFEEAGSFLDTVQMRESSWFSGTLVLHVFWRAE